MVRAAILSLAVSIEGMANCCIQRWPKVPSGGVDKALWLPTMKRLNTFLGVLDRAALDPASTKVTPIEELISKVRNGFVHPRIEHRPLTLRPEERELEIGAGEKYEVLGIPKSPQNWTPGDAETVLHFVCEFVDHFFVDACGFKPRTVAGLLFDQVDSGGKSQPITGPLNDTWHLLRKRWGIELKCLTGIFRPGKRVIMAE